MFARARSRIARLLAEYGATAVVVWLTTWAVGLAAFLLSTQAAYASAGVEVSGWQTWGTAYAAFVASYPLRVTATAILTPPLAAWVRRRRG